MSELRDVGAGALTLRVVEGRPPLFQQVGALALHVASVPGSRGGGTTTYECRRGRRWARKSGNHHGFRPIRHVYKQVRWALYKYVFGSFDNVAVTREFGQNTYPDYTWGERLWAGGQAS